MEQDQTQEKDQVLIARDNESWKIGAVTGMNDDGTPKMSDVKSAKLSDLVKFNIRQNPLEAFMSNFLRQCKNPTMFSFFKVDADNYEKEAPVMGEMLKDPETHKSMLEDREVKPSDEISETQKNKPVDESKIDWAELKERWGVDKEQLEKSGDLREMLFNRKSALVTITTDVGGKVQQVDARLSFQTDEQGKVNLVPHLIRKYPNLNEEYNGYKFTDEDKENLRTTGNLGKVVDLVDKSTGEVIPSYVSIDRYTHEMYHFPAATLEINDTIGKTKLSNQEIEFLKTGMAYSRPQ